MATQYTSLLGFALPVTGELSGTWGTTVNDSITELVEDSIASAATNSVAAGDWTLTTTGFGAVNQARCAILIPTGSPGVSRNIIAPSTSKAYFVINQSNAAVVVKGSATSGTTVAAGAQAVVAWNGSDFVTVATQGGAITATTVTATQLDVDNLRLDGNTLSSTDSNGNIVLAPNGTGDVQVDADTLRVGDSNANATVTTNGTGDLILNTNAGTNSGSITIQDAANGNIILAPNGTGRVEVSGTSSNAGGINLYEDTDNGTNKALLTAPAALGSDVTLTLPDVTSTLGYINTPINDQSTAYTLVLADAGKTILHPSADTTARTFTIPDNSSVAYPLGTVLTFVNQNGAGVVTIAITTDTMRLAGAGTTGSRTLAANGVATCVKLTSTEWIISGNGLT